MRTGKSGWHKRINRNYRSVTREAQHNDDYEVDPDALTKMHAAAKSAVLKRKANIAKDVGLLDKMLQGFSSSSATATMDDMEDKSGITMIQILDCRC